MRSPFVTLNGYLLHPLQSYQRNILVPDVCLTLWINFCISVNKARYILANRITEDMNFSSSLLSKWHSFTGKCHAKFRRKSSKNTCHCAFSNTIRLYLSFKLKISASKEMIFLSFKISCRDLNKWKCKGSLSNKYGAGGKMAPPCQATTILSVRKHTLYISQSWELFLNYCFNFVQLGICLLCFFEKRSLKYEISSQYHHKKVTLSKVETFLYCCLELKKIKKKHVYFSEEKEKIQMPKTNFVFPQVRGSKDLLTWKSAVKSFFSRLNPVPN